MKLLRTVIGSFPRLREDDREAIDAAVALQRDYHIDLLSDGEQKGDMIAYFAREIPGLAIENDFPIVIGKISPPEDPLRFQKIIDYNYVRDRYPDLKFKVTLTGPTALGVTCATRKLSKDYRSIMDFTLYEDLAEALRAIIVPLAKAGANIQIDEPFLSQGFTDLEKRVDLIDQILEGCDPSKCSIHVCGYLGKQPLLKELSRLEHGGILSHAFSTGRESENLGLLDRSIFQDSGKKLGAGVISVSPKSKEKIDAPETVASRISKIAKEIGVENIGTVHPDCGLRGTRPDLVEGIIRNFNLGITLFEESR